MDKDLSDSDCQTSQETDSEQSLVNKLKKNVTEIISNTPLSKWFRRQNETPTTSVRRRQDESDDEEDFSEFQPPTKRTKFPCTKETLSLNVSEALSPISSINNVKKPLYRNFPEPVAGPSGYQTRKMLNSTSFTSESNFKSVKTISETTENVFKNPRILNSTSESSNNVNKESQSDSEESTSGYSSGRIGSKEIVSQESSKQTSPLENSPRKARSLFQNSSSGHTLLSDRSLSPNRNSSLSSRMPSFNPSTFGSSNFVDRTLSTKRILNSPFYNGHTIYGGASAYGRNSKRIPQDMRKVLRQTVNIKPVNKGIEKGDLQLGKTARRILDTLEQYSSPISDAKKIPVASKKFRSEGTLTKYIGANPYSVRESRSASNRELQVPTVTDLLKMKIDQQKTRLQDSTEAVRQIATKSKSVLNEESYQIPVQRENDRRTGKIKTKITSVRHRAHIDEEVPEVKLNPVSLPIKELPKFDIIVPPPSQKPLTTSNISNTSKNQIKPNLPVGKPLEPSLTNTKPVESHVNVTEVKENIKTNTSIKEKMQYEFSAPLILAEYLKPLKALNNFKFSEPLIKKRRSIHPELDSQENKPGMEDKKSKKNNGENLVSMLSSNESNKNMENSSLMDKFKPKEGTWECSVCMIRNQADKVKCAACETSRSLGTQGGNKSSVSAPLSFSGTSAKSASSPSLLSDKYKAPSNTWECPTCMIRNKEDIQKCVACETKKPETSSSKASPKDTFLPYTVPSNTVPPTFTFGDKFKAPSDTWKCSACLVLNKNDVTKCIACETPKSGSIPSEMTSAIPSSGSGFGNQFAPPSSTWECSVCMIRNKDELMKCAACESAKPGAKNQTSSNPFGGEFKKKDDEWECEMCMVRNNSTTTKCQCCESLKPGASLSNMAGASTESSKVSTFNFGIDKNTATSFTFGIPPGTQLSENTPKTIAVQIFGEKKEKVEPKGDTPTFSFGVPASTSSETKVTEAKKDTPAITFGISKTGEKDQSKAAPTFSFGTPSKSEGAEPSKTTPTFSFGAASKAENSVPGTAAPTFTFSATNKIADQAKEGGDINSNKAQEPKKVNPLLKPSERLPEKSAVATSGFSFGLSKGSASTSVFAAPSIKLSKTSGTDESPRKRTKPASESAENPKVPMFTFKAPTTNGDINKTSPFSKGSEENKSTATPAGGFSFGAGAPKSTAPSGAIVTPTFGTTVSKTDNSNSGSMFKFGSVSSESQKHTNGFNFGLSTPSFGSKVSTSSPVAKPFAFASPAPSAASAPVSSGTNQVAVFGATPTKAPGFQFGSAPESKPQSSAPAFSFSTPSTESKTASQSLFGSTPSKAPTFGFGQSSAAAPAPVFNFASSNPKPDSAFGAGSTPNLFGAPNSKQEAVFGAAPNQNTMQNGMFNFGSGATTNQKAGFSFGASSGTTDVAGTAATQSGFSFGSSTATASPASSGGFNFSSSAPAFDGNAKPSFNFTGGAGITAFSAPTPQEGAMPQRKIKKAIRRTVR